MKKRCPKCGKELMHAPSGYSCETHGDVDPVKKLRKLNVSKTGVASVVGGHIKGIITRDKTLSGEKINVDLMTDSIGKKISRSKPAVAENPSWVLDHAIWEKAKKRAPGAPWGVITNIYKSYGGRVKGSVGDPIMSGTLLQELCNLFAQQDAGIITAPQVLAKADVVIGQHVQGHLSSEEKSRLMAYARRQYDSQGTHSQVGLTLHPALRGTADQLAKGVEHEKEHANTIRDIIAWARKVPHDPVETIVSWGVNHIAGDHITGPNGIPDYYDRLERMEREAKS